MSEKKGKVMVIVPFRISSVPQFGSQSTSAIQPWGLVVRSGNWFPGWDVETAGTEGMLNWPPLAHNGFSHSTLVGLDGAIWKLVRAAEADSALAIGIALVDAAPILDRVHEAVRVIDPAPADFGKSERDPSE